MLDKSIPYFGVLMTKQDMQNYPRYNLPQGYSFSGYKTGFDSHWATLIFELEQTNTIQEAADIFGREFLPYPERLEKQCLFVLDSDKNICATAALWHGEHFDDVLPRIHWVCTAKNHQGKGLVKALLTRLLEVYNELGLKDTLYLTTQTWSYKAINIYLQFGFKPYMEQKPVNWLGPEFESQNRQAWQIIEQKITQYHEQKRQV